MSRRGKAEEVYTLKGVTIKHETDKAIMVEVYGEEVWLPRSQIEDIDEDTGDITITAWIAKSKGLI